MACYSEFFQMSKWLQFFVKMSVYRVANLHCINSVLNTIYRLIIYNFTMYKFLLDKYK